MNLLRATEDVLRTGPRSLWAGARNFTDDVWGVRDLVGTAIGLGAAIGERPEAPGGVAGQPAVDGPAVDPVPVGDVGDRSSGVERLSHGQVTLLNQRKLRQHRLILLGSVEAK